MISGANEKELDLATARTDILLMCGTEQSKIVDEYYENQITNLQQENKQLKKEKDTLYNALITTRAKYNNDKARYRRKTKRYRNILTELEIWAKDMITPKPVQGGGMGFVQSINPKLVLDKIQKLKEKYK